MSGLIEEQSAGSGFTRRGDLKGRDLDNAGAGGGPAKKKDQEGPSWPLSSENLRDVPGWGQVA